MTISFTVPGEPLAQARAWPMVQKECARCHKKTTFSQCRCGQTPPLWVGKPYAVMADDKESVGYKQLVRMYAGAARSESEKDALLEGPLELSCTFWFLISASRLAKPGSKAKSMLRVGDLHSQKPDIKNLVWAIEDACEKVLYANDCQIARYGIIEKRWGEKPCAEVTVRTIEPATSAKVEAELKFSA